MQTTLSQLRKFILSELKSLSEDQDLSHKLGARSGNDYYDSYDVAEDENPDYHSYEVNQDVRSKSHQFVDDTVDNLKGLWGSKLNGLEAGGVAGFDSWVDQVDAAADAVDKRVTRDVDQVEDRLFKSKYNKQLQKMNKKEYDRKRRAKPKAPEFGEDEATFSDEDKL